MQRPVKLALALALFGSTALAAEQRRRPVIVSLPAAQEMPTTAASQPYLAARNNLQPLDLAKYGYVESETLISGQGQIFDWTADGKVAPLAIPAQPFANRVLVRKPADKSKFSGVVVVELMNDARVGDWAMLWGYIHETILANGDAWIGVTSPRATIGLKKFDPQRYAAVTYAPTEPLGCRTADDTMEEGLRFNLLGQLGALLKSNAPSNPLAGYGVKSLLMTAQGAEVSTYAVAMQNLLRLPGDRPIYDGFLIKSGGGLTKLHHCGQAAPVTDARAQLRNIGVPVISVIAQAEVAESFAIRRDDSDAPGDRYRRYEIAAATHLDRFPYAAMPSMADATKAQNAQGTVDWPFAVRCTPEITLSEVPIFKYVLDSSLQHLRAWVTNGVAPPRAGRMTVRTGGAEPELVVDKYGVGEGGIRSVYSDAPVLSYEMTSPGPGVCRELGTTRPIAWSELHSLYGSPQAYVAKALPLVDRMVADKWLTQQDAAQMRREVSSVAGPAVVASN